MCNLLPIVPEPEFDETASTSSRRTLGRRPRGAVRMTCEIPVDADMWLSNKIRFNAMLASRVAERLSQPPYRAQLVNPNNIPVIAQPIRTDYEN